MKGFWHLNTFLTNAPSKNPQPTHCFVWLNLSWHLTVFTFSREIFKQINGVAMGTKMGPNYANLFVGYVEEQIFNQFEGPKPELFGRYIDDCSWSHILHQRRIGTIYRFCQLFPSGPQIHMGNLWNISHVSRYQHFCPRQQIGNQCPTTNPQIRTVTYCTCLPTHLTSKTQFHTPNFSDSVGSAAKIQTLTPKCDEMSNFFSERGYPDSILSKALNRVQKRQ